MTERDGSRRDRGDWGADPELRTLLRTMDQTHSLPPLSSAQISGLVALTVESDAAGSQIGSPPLTRGATRRFAVPALAAAASLVVAGALASSTFGGSHDAVPTAEAPVVSASAAPSPSTQVVPVPSESVAPPDPRPPAAPTRLVLDGGVDLKCAVPNVEMLQLQEVAFAGTVSQVDGPLVTLASTEVFRGDITETVQLLAPSPDLARLLSAVTFEVGKTYLVSATDGQVTLCGFSAEDSPELRALYEQAFGG